MFSRNLMIGLFVFSPALAFAQAGGVRAGLEGRGFDAPPLLDVDAVQGYITIEGVAEQRVKATEIRVVLAVTAEGATSKECRAAVDQSIERIRGAWRASGVPDAKVAADFISVLPVFDTLSEKRGTETLLVEKAIAYRMQTNLHAAVATEAEVRTVIDRALDLGVTDIIAIDYSHRDLDQLKVTARERAVKAAKEKAETLLSAVFDVKPKPINVQERTVIRYPDSLYQSLPPQDASIHQRRNSTVPFIAAVRPKYTYYRGLAIDADARSAELPLEPEICVVSTVRLYYESPSTKPAASARPQR